MRANYIHLESIIKQLKLVKSIWYRWRRNS